MRLLNVHSLQLEQFNEGKIPPYAILSHTWTDGQELIFSELPLRQPDGSWPKNIKSKKGFTKVQRSANVAARAGFNYIWIDSCCIDKDSSTELQEALNSMFKWYEAAAVCYIYLEDFEWIVQEDGFVCISSPDTVEENLHWEERFKRCRWFTRGWTLQELIAPKKRAFFDKYWTDLSLFIDASRFDDVVTECTNIPRGVLTKTTKLSTINIATKMRWAARRETTRGEDIAYSLLGIFGVNMPLLYGQGQKKAFLCLQEEIIKNSADETIFAWTGPEERLYGLLAESPNWFVNCEGMKQYDTQTSPWSQTNKGLHVSLHTMESQSVTGENCQRVFPNCLHPSTGAAPSFELVQLGNDQYVRGAELSMLPFPEGLSRLAIYAPQELPEQTAPPVKIRVVQLTRNAKVTPYFPETGWDDSFRCASPAYIASHNLYVVTAKIHGAMKTHRKINDLGNVVVRIERFRPGWWACLCSINPPGQEMLPFRSRHLDDEIKGPFDGDVKFTESSVRGDLLITVEGPQRALWHFEGEIQITITLEDVPAQDSERKDTSSGVSERRYQNFETEDEHSGVQAGSGDHSSCSRRKRAHHAKRGGRKHRRRPNPGWDWDGEYGGWYREVANGEYEWDFSKDQRGKSLQDQQETDPRDQQEPSLHEECRRLPQANEGDHHGTSLEEQTREANMNAPGKDHEWIWHDEYQGYYRLFANGECEWDLSTPQQGPSVRDQRGTSPKEHARESNAGMPSKKSEWTWHDEYRGYYRLLANGEYEWDLGTTQQGERSEQGGSGNANRGGNSTSGIQDGWDGGSDATWPR